MGRREEGSGFDLAKGAVFRHLGAGVVALGIGGYGLYTAATYINSNFLSFMGAVDHRYAENKGVAEALLAKRQLIGYLEQGLEYFPVWRPISQQIEEEIGDTGQELADWRAFGESLEGFSAKDKRNAIEAYLEGLTFQPDPGKNEWSHPAKTVSRGFGDAEDKVGVAYFMALSSGHPRESLAVATGRDRRGFEHALLLIEEGGELWTLDYSDPGAAPLHRSGFNPRVYGQLNGTIVPTGKPNP